MRVRVQALVLTGLLVLALPAVARANHPAGRVDIWIGLIVLALPSVVVWAASALRERRRTPRIQEQASGPTHTATIRVEVYGKHGCGLCEAVKATLLEVRRDIPFDLREIDIDSSPELDEAYKERVPLVVINGRPAFKFRPDEDALRSRLSRELTRTVTSTAPRH